MACLFGSRHNGALMNHDAFIYVLLRLAAEDETGGTFRTAFEADPVGTLAAANHVIDLAPLHGAILTLPTKAHAAELLAAFLPDYDDTVMSGQGTVHDWVLPGQSPTS